MLSRIFIMHTLLIFNQLVYSYTIYSRYILIIYSRVTNFDSWIASLGFKLYRKIIVFELFQVETLIHVWPRDMSIDSIGRRNVINPCLFESVHTG